MVESLVEPQQFLDDFVLEEIELSEIRLFSMLGHR